MDREFGYGWGRVTPLIVVLPLLAGIILWKQKGEFSGAEVVIFLLIASAMTLYRAWPICRVRLGSSDIEINFPIPFRKGWRSRHEEIENYAEIAMNLRGKKFLIGGLLQRAGHARLMLNHAGTKDFEELNEALTKLYASSVPAGSDNDS